MEKKQSQVTVLIYGQNKNDSHKLSIKIEDVKLSINKKVERRRHFEIDTNVEKLDDSIVKSLYQRLNEHNVLNNNVYSLYVVTDSTNLDLVFKSLKDANYADAFDVCIADPSGLNTLVDTVNKYDFKTNLILLNKSGDLTSQLKPQSQVRAAILTDKSENFINNNSTKVYVYSNINDKNFESLVDKSQTNRDSPHSYLPLLVDSIKSVDWEPLIQTLSNDSNFKSESEQKGGCGCAGSDPVPLVPKPKTNSIFVQKGGEKLDINDHLYPDLKLSPFSDVNDSDNELKGGDSFNKLLEVDIDLNLVGKSVMELLYLRNKSNYLLLQDKLKMN